MITTTENGASVNNEVLTTAVSEQATPGLLRNAIDERIVKIRPMATPVDQLSRCAGARSCGSMKVDYYAVDVKAVSARLSAEIADDEFETDTANNQVTIRVTTDANGIFSPTETVLFPDVAADGVSGHEPLMLYVTEADNKGFTAVAVGYDADITALPCGSIGKDTRLVRMGRAATELDVQTAQFESLPRKRTNFCQIFK